ncbi:hypothetical protein [Gottfriedia acidiceleris]|uniref:ATP synthase F0 subunit 8 n=1 Tax=Gottfriedia acidiceleris TaxID=371036 RepID=A0ABY4JTU8_9BACI|nr:hypothetical protein [Gottfriedia acidiceleris]UPM56258.1 hypothetical protein MY490_10655 [Gottfriedia acidiceleris]
MTLFGYLFWGFIVVAIAFGFFMQKKFGTKAPDKSESQKLHEEITRQTHNNDRPRF